MKHRDSIARPVRTSRPTHQGPRINYCANRSSALKQRESSPVLRGYSQVLLKIGTGTFRAESQRRRISRVENDGDDTKGKGCDIGYALAASSCEEANSVDACTVTALDATTAFAVPDPSLLLAEFAGFFGSGYSADHSTELGHSVYFGSATV